MKKLSIFMSALALLTFASCDQKGTDLGGDFIEDGFYVVGEATGSDEIQSAYMMAAGFNEVDKSKRDGMYEKYVALEAGKEFSLAIYEAGDITYYGAELADMDLTGLSDNPAIVIKRGDLQVGADAPKMQVSQSGLYHVVLDLDLQGDLGTPIIIVAPTKWGVRGAMNGWGYTPMEASDFNLKKITYTIKNMECAATGGFKFAYGLGWKVNMDDMGKIKAEMGLGNNCADKNLPLMTDDLSNTGADIQIKRGIYDIELVWTLKGGNLGKNFTAKLTKVGSLPAVDYTNCVLELVGSGISAQTGSYTDNFWSWGNCLLASNEGKPSVNGKVYTWTWSNVELANDGWKIRTKDAAAQGDIANFDLGADIIDRTASVSASASGDIKVDAGTYNITLTINAEEDVKTLVIAAAN
jgi:hypothetical protein